MQLNLQTFKHCSLPSADYNQTPDKFHYRASETRIPFIFKWQMKPEKSLQRSLAISSAQADSYGNLPFKDQS